jgi:hypothetical protein
LRASGRHAAVDGIAPGKGWTRLFNGKDLSGLKVRFRSLDKDADPAKTFGVKDGSLATPAARSV